MISLQPLEKTMVKQVASLQSMENRARADIPTAAHEGPHARARWMCPKEAAVSGEPMQELLQELQPVGDPCWNSLFLKTKEKRRAFPEAHGEDNLHWSSS